MLHHCHKRLLQAHRHLFSSTRSASYYRSCTRAFRTCQPVAVCGRPSVKAAAVRSRPWSARYRRSSEPSEQVLWEYFFAEPDEWWDHRHCKRSSTSPDFKHRMKYWALWSRTYNGDEKENIVQRLKQMDHDAAARKPLIPPTPEEAWTDLCQHPWMYKDVRKAKTSANAPDFLNLQNKRGLWLSEAPDWVERYQELVLQHFVEKSIGNRPSLEMDLGAESSGGNGNRKAAEDLEWSEEDRAAALDKLLGFMDHDLSAELEPPQDVMRSGLMRHQRQGLVWMLAREAEGAPAGGLLGDEQGLGKTVQSLALIASNPRPPEWVPGDEVASSTGREGDAELCVGGTLIVVPKSLLDQWADAVSTWTNLRVLIYRDGDREKHQEPGCFAAYDIVLASYGVLLWDSPSKHDKALFRCNWWRVILDEAQYIKRHQTLLAASASLLLARYRWLLSGTPIQNSPEEAFSYLHFLRYEPFCEPAAFKKLFKAGDVAVVTTRLREILQPIMLRRTKSSRIDGHLILDLPKMLSTMHPVEFSAVERAFYTRIEETFRTSIRESDDNTGVKRKTAFAAIHRLRRACNHPWLASKFGSVYAPNPIDAEAAPCSSPDLEETPSISPWESLPNGDGDGKEPSSSMSPEGEPHQVWEDIGAASPAGFFLSAKLRALVDIIRQHSGDDKVLVFSQWTDMLDACEGAFEAERWDFVRLDGQMSSKQREAAIQKFNSDPDTRIFLVSLHAGKEGLNLAKGSRVVLLEPNWNPSHEAQAIARAHRIKQTKTVHVHRLFVPGTIEDKILELQDYKNKIVDIIVNDKKKSVREAGGLGMADIEYLLGLTGCPGKRIASMTPKLSLSAS